MLCLITGTARSEDPPVPVLETSPSAQPRMRVALVDSGVNYRLEPIYTRLARQADGSMIGYDYWDMDDRPFDAHPIVRSSNQANDPSSDPSSERVTIQRHGTRTASVLLREAPFVDLVPYRYPRPDMTRMQQLVEHAASHQVRIIGLPLGGNLRSEWQSFETAARNHPEIIFVASAGNNGRDIDRAPVYPAALPLENLLVVTSADDFVQPAVGVNWGRSSVDYLVPAESVPVLQFDGSQAVAAGSSYAVPRLVALLARLLRDDPELQAAELVASLHRRFANGIAPAQVSRGYVSDPQFDPRQTISVTRIDSWQPTPGAGTPALNVPLDVYILDPRWQEADVDQVLSEAQDILAACGIRFSNVQLHRVAAPEYLRDLETGAARTLFDTIRYRGRDRRAGVVLARDTRMQIPFDAEAFGRSNTRSRPWLADSVWLTLALEDRGIALAHELVHVLSNSGSHSADEGNLMLARTTGDNRTLTSKQCEQVRSHAHDSGLAELP